MDIQKMRQASFKMCGPLKSSPIMLLSYLLMNEIAFLQDDENGAKFSEPCTESLTSSEKEIANILGPQTFTGIPSGHDSMETVGENYFCVFIYPINVSLFEHQLL